MAAALLLLCGLTAFAGEDGPDQLTAALKQHYKLATIKLGAAGDSTFEPGTILVLRKDGIVSFGEKDASYAALCPSEISGGVVHAPPSPGCTSLAPRSRRLLKPSDTVCVLAIDVAKMFDAVSFFLAPYNPNDAGRKCGGGRAMVVFRLPKSSSGKISPARIVDLIDQTLSETGLPSQADAAPASGSVTGAVEVPADSDRPADEPAAGEPAKGQTVAIGQTVEQVRAILGPPITIAGLRTKTIYLYPTLKIVFNNGKVSSIQQL